VISTHSHISPLKGIDLSITIASSDGRRVAQEFARLATERGFALEEKEGEELEEGVGHKGDAGSSSALATTSITITRGDKKRGGSTLSLRLSGMTPEQALVRLALLNEVLARRA
jgi:hypothetical protein